MPEENQIQDTQKNKYTTIGIRFSVVGSILFVFGVFFVVYIVELLGLILLIIGLILCFYRKLNINLNEKIQFIIDKKNKIAIIRWILGIAGIISFFIGGLISDKDIWTWLYLLIFFLVLPAIGFIKLKNGTQNYILSKKIRNIIFVLCFFDFLFLWFGRGGIFILFSLLILGIIKLLERLDKQDKDTKKHRNTNNRKDKITTIGIKCSILILGMITLALLCILITEDRNYAPL